jgi:TRAP-type C4-dicarboxylate transport system permease small subunit
LRHDTLHSVEIKPAGGVRPLAQACDGESSLLFDKLEKFNAQVSGLFQWLSIAAMLLVVAITCIDVVGAKVFTWRLPGALDIVMLAQLVTIAFAAGTTLIKGRHIRVEFFVKLLPKRARNIIDSIVLLLLLALFSAIIWHVTVLGHSFRTSGEYSATIHIPYYPFAYGIALANIPVWLILFVQFIKMLKKSVQK